MQKVYVRKRKQKMDEFKKPPIGLKPKPFHDFARMTDILDAMDRYAKEEMPIPPIWVFELRDLAINNFSFPSTDKIEK